jgi:metal-sulfur cluster biosynthetic enzyme
MGLVRSVQITDGAQGITVKVTIGVTEPGCFMIYPFAKEARKVLGELAEVGVVDIDLDNGRDWMPSDMSERYRERLAVKRAHATERARAATGLAIKARPTAA